MIHSEKHQIEKGLPLHEARKILIMLHGRGATANDIITLSADLLLEDYYILAPQATNNTWYPFTFLSPVEHNEPWLGSAIGLIDEIILKMLKAGFHSEQIFLLGFSQGACLALEYSARNARKWGGIIAFSGGLIGDKIDRERYTGNFQGTRIFIGNSDSDPHIPSKRCEDTASLLTELNASVKLSIYPGMGHYINRQEILEANLILSARPD